MSLTQLIGPYIIYIYIYIYIWVDVWTPTSSLFTLKCEFLVTKLLDEKIECLEIWWEILKLQRKFMFKLMKCVSKHKLNDYPNMMKCWEMRGRRWNVYPNMN